MVTTLDGRETAPQNSETTQFQNTNGDPKKFFDAVIGGLSVGTPGTPALMKEAHNKWGQLDWSFLFNDAIKLAKNGFSVSKKLEASIKRDADRLKKAEMTKNYFFPNGKGLLHQQIVVNNAYAQTLQIIADEGLDDFYDGDIANDIISTVQDYKSNPGFLSKTDLKNYQIIERKPVCVMYKNYEVCGMGPPSSGGVAVGQILKLLEPFDLKSLGYENPLSWQLIGDASRLAFADRDRYLADSDFVNVPVAGLLDDEYLKLRSNKIKVGSKTEKIKPGNPTKRFVYNYRDDN